MIRVTKKESYTAIQWDGSADALHELMNTPGLRIEFNNPVVGHDELIVSYPNGRNTKVLKKDNWVVFDWQSTFEVFSNDTFWAKHRQENPTTVPEPQTYASGGVTHLSMQ